MSYPVFHTTSSSTEEHSTSFNLCLPLAPAHLDFQTNVVKKIRKRNGITYLDVSIIVCWPKYNIRPNYTVRPLENSVGNARIFISENDGNPQLMDANYSSTSEEEGDSEDDIEIIEVDK